MPRSRHPLLAFACLALGACAIEGTRERALTLEADASPADSGAAEPNLSTMPDGRVLLSWLAPAGDSTTALRFSVREADGHWGSPREVVRRGDLFVNWADFPSIVTLADGRLLAHWLQRSGKGKYAYDVRLAESRDGGATWGESVTPHTPGIPAEHGFAALLPTADSGAAMVFLDGGAGAEDADGAVMHLAFATWGTQGAVTSRAVLDHRVCDCCQTGIAMTTKGPIVVFRDRSDEEVRDIAVTRHLGAVWTAPRPIHSDGWRIDFCPVNGPAISSSGDTVAIAWFAAPNDSARVQVVYSTDGGATFGAPVRVDGGRPTGRVDIKMLDGGAALVTWVERTGGEAAEVWARIVRRDGTAQPHLVVSTSDATRSSGFPRMTRTADGVMMAWTMPGRPSAVRTAFIRVE